MTTSAPFTYHLAVSISVKEVFLYLVYWILIFWKWSMLILYLRQIFKYLKQNLRFINCYLLSLLQLPIALIKHQYQYILITEVISTHYWHIISSHILIYFHYILFDNSKKKSVISPNQYEYSKSLTSWRIS